MYSLFCVVISIGGSKRKVLSKETCVYPCALACVHEFTSVCVCVCVH